MTDCSIFMNITSRLALEITQKSLKNEPVLLCIDDTIITKYGQKFEDVPKLFEHTVHNGFNYLNGHCSVSLMLCVPVWDNRKIDYQSVPLGYRIWTKKRPNLHLLLKRFTVSCLSFVSGIRYSFYLTVGMQKMNYFAF